MYKDGKGYRREGWLRYMTRGFNHDDSFYFQKPFIAVLCGRETLQVKTEEEQVILVAKVDSTPLSFDFD